jgi:hypothetical protein
MKLKSMHQFITTRNRSQTRAGLAPVELVLAMPIMAFIMGLMVTLMVAASWKVRTATNARQVIWRDTGTRSTTTTYQPPNWPTTGTGTSTPSATPEPIATDVFSQHNVVRGPTVSSGSAGGTTNYQLQVKTSTLDIKTGLVQGLATLYRRFVLMKNVPPRFVNLSVHHQLYEKSQWTMWDMEIQNRYRRILKTYTYELFSFDASALSDFTKLSAQLRQIYAQPGLYVVDRDDEIYRFRGKSIDFYPRPNLQECTINPYELISVSQEFISRIKGGSGRSGMGVPIARYFISMYTQQLNALDPADPQRGALQRLIDQLDQDAGTLR